MIWIGSLHEKYIHNYFDQLHISLLHVITFKHSMYGYHTLCFLVTSQTMFSHRIHCFILKFDQIQSSCRIVVVNTIVFISHSTFSVFTCFKIDFRSHYTFFIFSIEPELWHWAKVIFYVINEKLISEKNISNSMANIYTRDLKINTKV